MTRDAASSSVCNGASSGIPSAGSPQIQPAPCPLASPGPHTPGPGPSPASPGATTADPVSSGGTTPTSCTPPVSSTAISMSNHLSSKYRRVFQLAPGFITYGAGAGRGPLGLGAVSSSVTSEHGQSVPDESAPLAPAPGRGTASWAGWLVVGLYLLASFALTWRLWADPAGRMVAYNPGDINL